MPQKIDNLLATAGESAARAAECFAEGPGDDVDPTHHSAIFMCAAPGLAKEAGRVCVIDHRERVVFFGEVANRRHIRDRPIHREAAVGGDQSKTGIFRDAQLSFEIGHVAVLVAKPLRFAEPNAVDDAGVIQFVADYRVLVGQERFEQTAVGIETGWIKNCVFGSEEFGERGLQLLVNVLRPANETHACHSKAMRVERFFGSGDERGMIGETEIIVCAHVEHAFAAGDRDVRILRASDNSLRFEKTLRLNFLECLRNLIFEFRDHM